MIFLIFNNNNNKNNNYTNFQDPLIIFHRYSKINNWSVKCLHGSAWYYKCITIYDLFFSGCRLGQRIVCYIIYM